MDYSQQIKNAVLRVIELNGIGLSVDKATKQASTEFNISSKKIAAEMSNRLKKRNKKYAKFVNKKRRSKNRKEDIFQTSNY